MSVTADDAVVQMVVSLLGSYLQTELGVQCAAAGLVAPTIGPIVDDTTTPAQRAHSVQVWMRSSDEEEEQAVNVSAPLRRKGEVVVQANVGSIEASSISRARALWAHAIERVLAEYWRLQTAVHLTALRTRVEHEASDTRENQGLVSSASKQFSTVQVQVSPIRVIVSYRQRADQTTRVV